MGVEYEAGKPGWNDAMNGLPGILGPGMPGTCEMLQILHYVHAKVDEYKREVEFLSFLDELSTLLIARHEDFAYWDACSTAREKYLASIVGTFSGTTVSWEPQNAATFSRGWKRRWMQASLKQSHGRRAVWCFASWITKRRARKP